MRRDEIEVLVRSLEAVALYRFGRTMLATASRLDYQEQPDWRIIGTVGEELGDAYSRALRGQEWPEKVIAALTYHAEQLRSGLVVPSRQENLREVADAYRQIDRSFRTVGLGDPLVRGEGNGRKLP